MMHGHNSRFTLKDFFSQSKIPSQEIHQSYVNDFCKKFSFRTMEGLKWNMKIILIVFPKKFLFGDIGHFGLKNDA